MSGEFEKGELTRKALTVWGNLLARYEIGAISGGTFRTSFQAVYDAVSGLADWDVIRSFLEQYNRDIEDGEYGGADNVQIFQREDGNVLAVLLLEGAQVKSLISTSKAPLLCQTVEYSDELEARYEFTTLCRAYRAKDNFHSHQPCSSEFDLER